MNKELERIKKQIIPILKKHKIKRAGIFGSHARGEQKEHSDIDLLIESESTMDLIEIINLKNHLEENIGKKVDLGEYSCIRKELRKSILKEEIPILR